MYDRFCSWLADGIENDEMYKRVSYVVGGIFFILVIVDFIN